MKNILIPTNLTKESSIAYSAAAKLAKENNTGITLYHHIDHQISPLSYWNTTSMGMLPNELRNTNKIQEVEKKLSKHLKHPAFEGLHVNYDLSISDDITLPSMDEILTNDMYSLIVMGTGKDDTNAQHFAHILTEKTDKPVILIKTPVTSITPRKALVLVDFDDLYYRPIFEDLIELAKNDIITFDLLYVSTSKDFKSSHDIEKHFNKMVMKKDLQLAKLLTVNAESASEAIQFATQKSIYDIVAIPYKEQSSVEALFIESQTEAIINECNTTLLIEKLPAKRSVLHPRVEMPLELKAMLPSSSYRS